ncbi:hypothetical protein NQ314_006215 [Rhamnusium bicolor]|uniref:Uncharacterized protein n=1 Tax=Rhamnusium bicolor TaxID=1586634 RepID=A0AAV8Z8G9_9CUCU|nr:hypothetical protein NQ314_006215 [Rhamnusium bicolor]
MPITTLVQQMWNAVGELPQKKWGTDIVQSLEEMYPLREAYSPIDRELTDNEIQSFRQKLGETSIVGFSWLLKPEISKEVSSIIPSIENILYSEEYITAQNKVEYCKEACAPSEERSQEIQLATISQHANENWHYHV